MKPIDYIGIGISIVVITLLPFPLEVIMNGFQAVGPKYTEKDIPPAELRRLWSLTNRTERP